MSSSIPGQKPYKGVKAPARRFTSQDVTILSDIIRETYSRRVAGDVADVALLDVLQAYDFVLRTHGLAPAEDTFYYRALLKMSVDAAEDDWWGKLDRARLLNDLKFRAIEHYNHKLLAATLHLWKVFHHVEGESVMSRRRLAATSRLVSSRSFSRSAAGAEAAAGPLPGDSSRLHASHLGFPPPEEPDVPLPMYRSGMMSTGGGRPGAMDSPWLPHQLPDDTMDAGRTMGLSELAADHHSERASVPALSTTGVPHHVMPVPMSPTVITPSTVGTVPFPPPSPSAGATTTTTAAATAATTADHHHHHHDHHDTTTHTATSTVVTVTGPDTAPPLPGSPSVAVQLFDKRVDMIRDDLGGHTTARFADPSSFGNFRLVASTWRQWVTAVNEIKLERERVELTHQQWLQAKEEARLSCLARYFSQWRAWMWATQADRVLHYQTRAFHRWKRFVSTNRPVPLANPRQIRSLFRWVALTLPRAPLVPSSPAQLVPPAIHRLSRLRQYLLCRLRLPSRRRPLLEHATAVLDAFSVASVFVSWGTWTRRVRALRAARMRGRLQSALDRWEIWTHQEKNARRWNAAACRATLKRRFRSWVAFRLWRRRLRACGTSIASKRRSSLIRAAWHGWKVAQDEAAMLLHLDSMGLNRIARSRKRGAFKVWRRNAVLQRSARRMRRRFALRRAAVVWGAWSGVTSLLGRKTRLRRTAASWVRGRVLRHTLAHWRWARWAVAGARRLRRRHVLSAVLTRWKVGAETRKAVRSQVATAMTHHAVNVQRHAFAQWVHWASMERRLRLARYWHVFSKWQRHVAAQRRADATRIQAFVDEYTRRRLVAWHRVWTCAVAARGMAAKLGHTLAVHRLRVGFAAWRAALGRLAAVRSFVHRRELDQASHVWDGWLAFVAHRRARLARRAAADAFHVASTRRSVLTRWGRAYHFVQCEKAIRATASRRCLADTLHGWQARTTYVRRCRHAVQSARAARHHRCLSDAWRSWLVAATKFRSERLVRVKRGVWRRLVSFTRHRRRCAATDLTIQHNHARRRVHSAWQSWRRSLHALLRMRAATASAEQHYRRRLLRRCLMRGFRGYVAAAHRYRTKLGEARAHAGIQLCLRVLAGWRQVVLHHKHLKSLGRTIVRQRRVWAARTHFRLWCAFVVLRRAEAASTAVAVAHARTRLLVTTINSWRQALHDSHQGRRETTVMTVRILASWRQLVDSRNARRRQREAAAQWWATAVARGALHRLRQFVSNRRDARAILARHAAKFRRHHTRWVLQQWLAVTVQSRVASAVLYRNHLTNLSTVFTAWHAVIQRRRYCLSAVTSARTSALHRRLLAWRAAVDDILVRRRHLVASMTRFSSAATLYWAGRAVTAWAGVTRASRFHRHHVLKSAVARWRVPTARSATARAFQAGHRLRVLQRGLVSWWTAQAIQALARRALRRRMLRRWAAASARQATAKALLRRTRARVTLVAFQEWARQTAESLDLARAVAQFQLAAASANSGHHRRRVPLGSPSPVAARPRGPASPPTTASRAQFPRMALDFGDGHRSHHRTGAATATTTTNNTFSRVSLDIRRPRRRPSRSSHLPAHPALRPAPFYTHTRATVDVATSRWVYLPAWKALHSWQVFYARAVLKRRITAFARAFAWLQLAGRVFGRLQDAVDARRHLNALDAYHHNVCRRRAWKAWRMYITWRAAKHRLEMTAAYHYSRRGVVGRIRWWRHHTRYAQWYRSALEDADTRAAVSLLHRSLLAWAAVTPLLKHQRRQAAAADRLWQITTLRRSFRTIRVFGRRVARSMAVLRDRQARLQSHTINLAFQCWAVASRRSAAAAALRHRALSRAGLEALQAWRRMRWASTAAAMLYTARTLRRAFGGWQWVVDHSAFLSHREQALGRLSASVARRLTVAVFRGWAGVVARRRLATLHAVRHMHTVVKPRCFDAWTTYVSARRRVKRRWLQAVVHHTTVRLDECLLAWKLYVGRRLQHAAVVASCTARRNAVLLATVMDAWVTAAARERRNRRKLRATRAARMRRLLLTVLFRWRGLARSRVSRRHAFKALVSRGLARTMRMALSGWVEYTLSRRFRHSLETVGLTRLCVRTIRRWSLAAKNSRRRRERIASLQALHRRRYAKTVLAMWRMAARQAAAFTRQLAHQLLTRLHDRVVDRRLNDRKVELCRQRRQARLTAVVFSAMVRRTAGEVAHKLHLVTDAFGWWAHKVRARHVIGVMLLRARREWRTRAKASAFHHLAELTAIRARREYAAAVYRRNKKAAGLAVLRQACYTRLRLRRGVARWRHPLLWRTFGFWVKFTRLRVWMTPVLGRDVDVVKRYMKRWVKATAWLRRAHRPAVKRAFSRFRSFRAAKAFSRWHAVVSTRSALASLPASLSGRRSAMALAKWRRRARAQARMAAAGRAIAANHNRVVVTSTWRAWWTARMAARHLCRKVCGPIVGGWVTWSRARIAKRNKLNASVATVFMGVRRRAFFAWASHTAAAVAYRAQVRREAERRMRLTRRLERLRLAWLQTALARWHSHARIMTSMYRIAFRFTLKTAGVSAFYRWKDKTQRRRRVAALTRRSTVRARIALRRSGFNRFVAGVKASARHRHAKAIAAQFRDQVALRIVLRSWWQFTTRRIALRGLTGTVCRHLAGRALAIWRRATRVAAATEEFVEAREWEMVRRAFDGWLDRVAGWKYQHEDEEEAALHWRVRHARQAVQHWRWWCAASIDARQAETLADNHAYGLLTARYMARWQRFTVMSQQTAVSNSYARRRVLTMGMDKWLTAWKARRARAHRHQTVRYHIQLALILWRRRVTAKRLSRRHFMGRMLRRLRARVIARQGRRVRDAVLAEGHHRRATLRRVIARWARRSQLGSRVRSYVQDGTQRLAVKRRRRMLLEAFAQWEDRASRYRRLRAVAKVQPRLLLHKIVKRWGDSTRETATDRVQWNRAVTFFNQRIMALSFAAWKGLLFSEVQRRVVRARSRVSNRMARTTSFASSGPDWSSPVSPPGSGTMTGSFITSPAWSSTTPGTGISRASTTAAARRQLMAQHQAAAAAAAGGGGGGGNSSFAMSSALWTASKSLIPDPPVARQATMAPTPSPQTSLSASYHTPPRPRSAGVGVGVGGGDDIPASFGRPKFSSYVAQEPPQVPVVNPTSVSAFLRSSGRAEVYIDEEGVARLDMTAPY